jgi:isopenicillin-N N-acyltransferase-like protein
MNAEMPIVVLAGTPYERGLAHGSRFRTEIASILDRDFGSMPEPQLCEARTRAAKAFSAIRTRAPHLAEEISGIAAGANAGVPDIVLRSGFELLQPAGDTGCSALAFRGGHGSIAAQNWDGLAHKQADLALFLHFSPDGFQLAIVGSLGGLGNVGMNDRGLALVNTDLILKGSRDGLPSQAVRRLALECADVESAVDVLSSQQHMGGRSYLLADRAGAIAAVEVSAESGIHRLAGVEAYLHTNHALLPATCAEEDATGLGGMYPSSAARMSALQSAFAREERTVEGAKRVLRDETGAPDAVCKTASRTERTQTAFSIVMDCSRGEMHLAAGRPSISDFRKIVLPLR